MKSVPVVLALWLMASAAGAAEPAGSTGSSSKPPSAETKTKSGKSRNVAAPPGQVTLQGDLTCAKCGLHEAAQCQSVLVVKEDGKDIKYYLAKNAVASAEHEKVCGSSVSATVTGTVTDEGGHKVLTAKTVSVADTTKRGAENGAAPMTGHGHE